MSTQIIDAKDDTLLFVSDRTIFIEQVNGDH